MGAQLYSPFKLCVTLKDSTSAEWILEIVDFCNSIPLNITSQRTLEASGKYHSFIVEEKPTIKIDSSMKRVSPWSCSSLLEIIIIVRQNKSLTHTRKYRHICILYGPMHLSPKVTFVPNDCQMQVRWAPAVHHISWQLGCSLP